MTNPLRSVAAAAVAAVLAATGCSGQQTPTGVGQRPTSAMSASTAPPATTPPAVANDAATVLATLIATGLPVTNGKVQDENTDPNDLLGRPNGYTSRASFDVPGGDPAGEPYRIDRGGVIEVWPDAAGAKRRADYIATTLQAAPILGTEYHHLNGPVLVRISGKVKPSVAAKFEPVVASL